MNANTTSLGAKLWIHNFLWGLKFTFNTLRKRGWKVVLPSVIGALVGHALAELWKAFH